MIRSGQPGTLVGNPRTSGNRRIPATGCCRDETLCDFDRRVALRCCMTPPARVWHAAAARVRLVVWGKACGRQVEPNPAEMAQRLGAEMSVLDWQRLPTMMNS